MRVYDPYLSPHAKFSTHLSIRPISIHRKLALFRAMLAFEYPEILDRVQVQVHMYEGEYLMAKKREGFNWHMVACRLTDGQAKTFQNWMDDQLKSKVDPVSELASKNLKVSITWVDQSNAFVVTVTDPEERKSISSWSDNWMEGLWMAAFKVFVIFDGGPWEDLESSNWG